MSDGSGVVRNRVDSVRLATLRRRHVIDTACFAALALCVAAAMATVDYFLVLSLSLRANFLVGAGTILITAFIWFSRRRGAYLVRHAAADIEAEYTDYGQRIRTTLDYSDPAAQTTPASAVMVRALTAQTRERVQRDDFTEVVRNWPSVLAVAVLAVILFSGLASLIAVPEGWISVGRTMLLPIHYSQLTLPPVVDSVPLGEDVTIVAEVSGRPVEQATVHYRASGTSDPWQELALQPAEKGQATQSGLSGRLIATLEKCQQSIEFRVSAGPINSKTYRINVLQPLEMQSFTARVQPPSYTRLEPESVDTMDLKVLEGSNVGFTLTLNRQPAEARLVPVDDNHDLALDIPAIKVEGSVLSGQLDSLAKSQQFLITARAGDGMRFESPRFRIHVRPDGKPKIRFVRPPEDLEVTPTTELPLAIQVSDDLGISKVGVLAQVGDGAMETLWEQEFTTPEMPRESSAAPMLYLEDHEVTFQDAVTYYAFVEDNRPGEARRTTTELRFIDIRPYKRAYQILDTGGT